MRWRCNYRSAVALTEKAWLFGLPWGWGRGALSRRAGAEGHTAVRVTGYLQAGDMDLGAGRESALWGDPRVTWA